MARRSARLASLSKAPKQQSTEAPTLSSVAERDDSPGEAAVQNLDAVVSSPPRVPRTPSGSSPMKPPMSEMHPSKVHPTMGPPSSGLRLGFTDIKQKASRDDSLPAVAQTTPSRVAPPSSPFTFRFTRNTPSDLKLGPEAQRMMDDLREEAAKIKAELVAKREAEKMEEENVGGRRIAQAKGKASRFSAAHMAEFKKMDSIENHPSAFRAQPGRMTPLKAGVKRSQSRANLDDPETVRAVQPTPASATAKTKAHAIVEEPAPTPKRARQHVEDDASSKRPVSRDGSSIPAPKPAGSGIPRSKSNLNSLMTPTKSSLARATSVKTPCQGSLIRSPSKATLSGMPRSATTSNLTSARLVVESEPAQTREIKSPKSRFDRVKAMLRGAKASATKTKSALPLPSAFTSKTPGPVRPERHILPVPMTTPGRKLTKRVAFTPETQRAAVTQNSPSPVKSGIPPAKSRQVLGDVYYPSLDAIMAEQTADGDVSYPDLSARRPLPEPPKTFKAGSAEPSVPSEFTFRSDHTISFGSASKSFGSSPGQASVRAVRPSILPSENMPGSFPTPTSTSTSMPAASVSSPNNKENEAPRSVFLALPHGMTNKKRHRVSTDEEEAEQEAAERAAKKRRQEEVPEGDALLAPRLTGLGTVSARKRVVMSASPKKAGLAASTDAQATPSPVKKRQGISLSRLNMLARPKMRK
ncbi:hypothetical protein MFIFM68171_10288 [Madurella fahalii]|uniref:Erythromycin esterase n=1 Tax=Madurella fahalii TaxID=1157608 RepID=A0ABQ0GQR4_9PEZI